MRALTGESAPAPASASSGRSITLPCAQRVARRTFTPPACASTQRRLQFVVQGAVAGRRNHQAGYALGDQRIDDARRSRRRGS